MRKATGYLAGVIAAVLITGAAALPSYVQAEEAAIDVTVLGDSIAKGYSADKEKTIKCYGEILAQELSDETGTEYSYRNYAKNGLDTEGLNGKVLAKQEVQESVKNSDIVLLTMGSNDLLNEFKDEAKEILKSERSFTSAADALEEVEEQVKQNPFLVFRIIDALGNWDYGTFEKEWVRAMDAVTTMKPEDAQIVVTNIYNPMKRLKLPGTMNQVVEEIIGNMNDIIEKHAGDYDYSVVDLFESEITEHVQKDGLHPDQEGQELIARLVRAEVTGYGDGEESGAGAEGGVGTESGAGEVTESGEGRQAVDGVAVKGEDYVQDTPEQADASDKTEEAGDSTDDAAASGSSGISWATAAGFAAALLIVCLGAAAVVSGRKKSNSDGKK